MARANKEYKAKLKEELSMEDRAYYYFYVNRSSVNSTGGFSVSTLVRRNLSKATSDYLSIIDGLEEYHIRLSNVVITNRDAMHIINKYDNDDVFMYLDPPYVHSTRTSARYPHDMTDEQHIELLNTVIKCKSKILISGYDNDLYNVLVENGWNKYDYEIKTRDGMNRRKTKIETLWYNYEK